MYKRVSRALHSSEEMKGRDELGLLFLSTPDRAANATPGLLLV